MTINIDRLEETINSLGRIGQNEAGGIDRALGSEAEREARSWLINYWQRHLIGDLRIDEIANLWYKWEGQEALPPIVLGSHHDAVPNGGRYDGALGVLAATEIMRTLQESGIKLRHPLEIVSFTGEEPNPYNVSTLGSKVLSGRLVGEALKRLTHQGDGSPLGDCIHRLGGNLAQADRCRIKPGEIGAFIELHVEQGKRLFQMAQSSCAVGCITGIYREEIRIEGEANHGGTTWMQDRHDALLAACELNLAFEKLLRQENNPEVVGTVGAMQVMPGAVSIIPDKVALMLEIRTADESIRRRLIDGLEEAVKAVETARGVRILRRVNLDQKEMPMDREVVEAVCRGIEATGEQARIYTSMAGHDAANMQRVAPSAMIFTQSVNGMSHCPQEYSRIEDIGRTVSALLEAVLILDEEMDHD